VQHPPNLFEFLPHSIPITVSTLVVCVVLVLVLSVLVRRGLAGTDGVVPDESLTLRNVLEILLEGAVSLMREVIGDEWPRWMPLVGTLGFFILVSNLMGLVPFVTNPTSFIETNLAWACLSFVTYHYAGISHHGVHYLNQFFPGPVWLKPLMFLIEVISHLARVLSLTIRLTANMFADHTLIAVFLSMPVVGYFVPWVFMGLGLFVAFLQAFIFMFLTMIYIGLALEEAH
jgi:F-type H+-transporting ATPase subunit a